MRARNSRRGPWMSPARSLLAAIAIALLATPAPRVGAAPPQLEAEKSNSAQRLRSEPERTLMTPLAKPAAKPADEPADEPADKPADKPADRPAAKPADKPEAKSASEAQQPPRKLEAKPAAPPSGRPATKAVPAARTLPALQATPAPEAPPAPRESDAAERLHEARERLEQAREERRKARDEGRSLSLAGKDGDAGEKEESEDDAVTPPGVLYSHMGPVRPLTLTVIVKPPNSAPSAAIAGVDVCVGWIAIENGQTVPGSGHAVTDSRGRARFADVANHDGNPVSPGGVTVSVDAVKAGVGSDHDLHIIPASKLHAAGTDPIFHDVVVELPGSGHGRCQGVRVANPTPEQGPPPTLNVEGGFNPIPIPRGPSGSASPGPNHSFGFTAVMPQHTSRYEICLRSANGDCNGGPDADTHFFTGTTPLGKQGQRYTAVRAISVPSGLRAGTFWWTARARGPWTNPQTGEQWTFWANELQVNPPGTPGNGGGDDPPPPPPPPTQNRQASLDAFEDTLPSWRHARCTGCHSTGTFPSGIGHPTTIQGRNIGNGDCATCHTVPNRPRSGQDAPVPVMSASDNSNDFTWGMAPASNAYAAGDSFDAICTLMRGNSGGAQGLRDHLSMSPRVRWGFAPHRGVDQSTHDAWADKPTQDHAQFMALIDVWLANGGVCPSDP